MTWQKLYFLKTYFHISRKWNSNNNTFYGPWCPLCIFISSLLFFSKIFMHNPFPCKNEKKYQKSFHFHLTHQYLPLIMSKRISKKIIKSRWVGHKKVFKGSAWCICFIFSWPKKVVEVHSKNLSFQRLWRNQLLKLPNEGVLCSES